MYKTKLTSVGAQTRLKTAALALEAFQWREQGEQYCVYRLDGQRRGESKSSWTRIKQYSNGTLLIDAATPALLTQMLTALTPVLPKGATLSSQTTAGSPGVIKPDGRLDVRGVYIGTDESGKGDYFGPLVIAGACVNDADVETLRACGAMDSKKLSDATIARVAAEIRQALGPERVLTLELPPPRYNEVYEEFRARGRNLNHLLAWGHATVIDRLLDKNPTCHQVIADQFGAERYLRDALAEKARAEARLYQTPRAEANMGVAAASILARDCFVRKLRALGEAVEMTLPPGAGAPTQQAAVAFTRRYGKARLSEVAKLHFKTTQGL